MTTDKKAMLAAIDKLQTAIGDFIHLGDDYISGLRVADWDVEGEAIRNMQGRLARLTQDLSDLYRRIDA